MSAGAVPATPWRGGDAGSVAHCVLAPNPGPMTLEGTNTWVLHAPGSGLALVVDPGPDHEGHLGAVLEAVRGRGARVGAVLLTHGHPDHSAGARRFGELAGAPVRALDPAHRLGGEGLAGGDVVAVDGLRLDVVATPGHTADSLSFLLTAAGSPGRDGGVPAGPPGSTGPAVPPGPEERRLLTGDTVLGRGTTVVAHPDGRLADYLASLRRLERLAQEQGLAAVLPGHGPVLDRPLDAVRFYLRHRQERLDQVRAAVADGARTPREVVERVYTDVPPEVLPAAELSVRAQLEYLRET